LGDATHGQVSIQLQCVGHFVIEWITTRYSMQFMRSLKLPSVSNPLDHDTRFFGPVPRNPKLFLSLPQPTLPNAANNRSSIVIAVDSTCTSTASQIPQTMLDASDPREQTPLLNDGNRTRPPLEGEARDRSEGDGQGEQCFGHASFPISRTARRRIR
jgi:hypothetical protein